MPLMILPFAIILLSVFSLLRNRSQRSMKERQDAFWEKEQRANRTRRQDISQLDYIQIPLDTFPIGACTDPGLSDLEQTLQTLSSRKILNLSGISNTDLKLQYGAANLNILSDCDANFTTLARTLVSYADRLLALGRWQDAVRVLEFGVACGSDVSKNYTLLGNVYREHGETGKLNELTEIVRSSDMLLKDTILKQLKE
ncbi:MAG: hypothetical protein K2P69_05015 [Eubacterium sp.]|nr:hypothetical protein [Eubacterium sp.]